MLARLWGWRGSALVALLATVVLVVCLRAGGGAPEASPPGIPDPGWLTGWGLSIVKLFVDVAGISVVGLCTTAVLLARRAELGGERTGLITGVRRVAAAWAVLLLAQFALTASDVFAHPVDQLTLQEVSSFLTGTTLGRTAAVQVVLVLVVAVLTLADFGRRWQALLAFGVAALLPPVLTGHAATSADESVAVVSLIIHVGAVSVWVGGLVGLTWITVSRPGVLRDVLPMFSSIAGWCFGAVLATGLLNAAIRLATVRAPFSTGYGQLVVVKVVAIGGLAAFGFAHRQRTIPDLVNATDSVRTWRVFARVAGAEVCLMAATVGIAVALSRTPTPLQTHVHASALIVTSVQSVHRSG